MIVWVLACGGPAEPTTAPIAPAPAAPPEPAAPTGDRAVVFTAADLGFDDANAQVERRHEDGLWDVQYQWDGDGVVVQSAAYLAKSTEAATRTYTAVGVGAANGADATLQLVDTGARPGWGDPETCKALTHGDTQVGWYCWAQRGDRVASVMVAMRDPEALRALEPFGPRAGAAFRRLDTWAP
jgi:hypothetical protein